MVSPLFREVLATHLTLSGMTQKSLSARSRVSQASLSRYLSGKTRPSRPAVDALDTALGTDGLLLEAWKSSVNEELPPFLRDVDYLEREAVRIDLVSPVVVPGLLWSPSYAEAVYRAGRKVVDVERLARMRSNKLGQISATVSVVFPVTALTCVAEPIRTEQVQHLLNLPERVAVHLLPEGTLLMGIPGPMMLFRMRDGREIAASDHLEANAVYGDGVLPRIRELLRDAYALALPSSISRERLMGVVS
ncbi:Scr1 family TA system antitoxin-like transcriptional regulator [Nocardiopsis sp. DSM 44743]|uniref:Scr1 family TA system antitoxin-like transcriptional regulator n=2 Tax=Nocardiopsis lambiniae TaxID=3075539 RepID=A0ABU2M644_9ACTN|nr:Scr1 family TA system antitoxin-like transcriptional regulator [Nocardiopsis sp. DSM 44743]MDT0328140.1 Scr1 family TA system antitoxin-like transcriptional regulator [Nocardiopsis sp. DSM 44743]